MGNKARFLSTLGVIGLLAMAVVWQRGPLFSNLASLASIPTAHAFFDQNNLINDPTFIDINAMTAADIQTFLNAQGGFLKGFSENGRSAAQIIYDASHGFGEASGQIFGINITTGTGTVNPRVLLTTLQKEQGLLNMAVQNNGSLNAAMGYACPDSGGCKATYAGFTKQVENAAWQFRYNYEAAMMDNTWRTTNYGTQTFPSKPGFVGQTVSIDSTTVTFANAGTASLYRYTPHISGNQSFSTLYTQYFLPYSYQFIYQNAYPTLAYGGAYNFVLQIRNTGSATWQKGTVNLGTSRSLDRIPEFTREGPSERSDVSGWIAPNRVQFQEATVAPGTIATYSFWMRNDTITSGVYREYFQPVVDGVQWMTDNGIYWDVTTGPVAAGYHYQYVVQNTPSLSLASLAKGQAYRFTLTIRNTGTATWHNGVVNLGTDQPRDRIPSFTRDSNDGTSSGWTSDNRVTMQESTVAPNETASFIFWMRNDFTGPGTRKEYFQPVADGITWFPENYGIYWNVATQ